MRAMFSAAWSSLSSQVHASSLTQSHNHYTISLLGVPRYKRGLSNVTFCTAKRAELVEDGQINVLKKLQKEKRRIAINLFLLYDN